MHKSLNLLINKRTHKVLALALRYRLKLVSTKQGLDKGDCGFTPYRLVVNASAAKMALGRR